MFAVRRSPKTLVTTLCAGVLAFVLTGADAHAQISGTIGGDLVDGQLMEPDGIGWPASSAVTILPAEEVEDALTDGTSNTVIFAELVQFEGASRVEIAADVTTADAAGGVQTTHIIAVLIGLFAPRAPGFMDYTDDSCMLAAGGPPDRAGLRACSVVGRAFRALVQARRTAISPDALMLQTPRGLALWTPR
jgi:hypothetical protein